MLTNAKILAAAFQYRRIRITFLFTKGVNALLDGLCKDFQRGKWLYS
jgi:hypothetical protein